MAVEFVTLRDGNEQNCQLLPPGDTGQLESVQAPSDDARSFLIDQAAVLTKEKKRMPTDPTTGLPFAILPILDTGDINPRDKDIDYHHHFYNRRHPDLEGELILTPGLIGNLSALTLNEVAGFSVRMSRGQLLPKEVHWMVHNLYKIGPVLPHTLDEKFETVVLACSGAVPRYGIDVTAAPDKRFVYMDEELFGTVTDPKLLCTERRYFDRPANHRRRVIGNFLVRYAIDQDLTHISPRIIKSFLRPRDEAERMHRGNFILKEAMRSCVEPIADKFDELQYLGMVQPGKASAYTAVRKYIHPEKTTDFFPLLHSNLAAVA